MAPAFLTRTALAVLALALPACAALPAVRQRPAAASPRTDPPAAVAPTVDLPAAAGGTLTVDLPAGTYVRLVVTPSPRERLLRRRGADGAVQEQFLPAGASEDAPLHLSWVSAAAGETRFELVAADPAAAEAAGAAAGAVGLEEVRPAAGCDARRAGMEQQLALGRHEQDRAGGDPRLARALLAAAVEAASAVGEQHALAAALIAQADSENDGTETARALLRRAVDLARAVHDAGEERTALLDLASLVEGDGQETAVAAVLARDREDDDLTAQEQALDWLALGRARRGRAPAAALAAYAEALAIGESRGAGAGKLASYYNTMGMLQSQMGAGDAARRSLAIGSWLAEQAHDPDAEAFALFGSFKLHLASGDLEAAYEEVSRAALLLAASGPSYVRAASFDGLATTLLYLGQPERARRRFEDALADFTALGDPTGIAQARLGIGEALAAAGQTAPATEQFNAALAVIRPHRLQGMEGRALLDLGRAHRELHQPELAVAELESALAQAGQEVIAHQAIVLVELAKCYAQARRMDAAAATFRRAIAAGAGSPVVEAAAQAGLAGLSRDRGDLPAARAAIGRALELTERLRGGMIRPDQRVSFLASLRGYYELAVDLSMRLEHDEPGAGHAAAALAASEQARSRELLDLLARERVDPGRGIPAPLKERAAEIGERIAGYEKQLLAAAETSPPAGRVEQLGRELADAEEEEHRLQGEILRQQPAYAALLPAPTLGLAAIQERLDAQTALVEYFLGKDESYLFVVTREGLAVHRLEPRARIAAGVAAVRGAISADSWLRSRRFADDAYQLYARLLLPAAAELAGKERLIVAPDGPLYALSFEALLTAPVPGGGGPRRDLPYLVRDRAVSYVPSASVLALLAGRGQDAAPRPPGVAFVGFGDPHADLAGTARGTRGGTAAALPGARDEVERIARLFPRDEVAVFTGAAATEDAVKTDRRVAAARNLHFALHGVLDESEPERSGLQLDGLLTVREIFDLELHADLVVLSACRTGQGAEVSGEGLIGMTRAFLYAGAESIVVGLWEVDDQSTPQLMEAFYRHLLETGDRSRALRLAKLDLLQTEYGSPYFWAPFILMGQPR